MARSFEPWRLPGLKIVCSPAPAENRWLWDRVLPLPPDVAASLASESLRWVSPASANASLFVEATAVVSGRGSLAATVADRVGVVHLLKADFGIDVSHSEPQWTDRIFVSVPERGDRVGALRLAESIIHEAMHLHLTHLETAQALVRDVSAQLYSPWRRAHRPLGGVLHGLFVFVCLRAFLGTHGEPTGSLAGHHVRQRLRDIDAEIAEIDVAALGAGLTTEGGAFLARLLAEGVQRR